MVSSAVPAVAALRPLPMASLARWNAPPWGRGAGSMGKPSGAGGRPRGRVEVAPGPGGRRGSGDFELVAGNVVALGLDHAQIGTLGEVNALDGRLGPPGSPALSPPGIEDLDGAAAGMAGRPVADHALA